MSNELYKNLGVENNATDEEIRKAYREASKIHHPDHGGESEAFHRISESYQILKDPRRRKFYDETGGTDSKLPDTERLAADVVIQLFSEVLKKYGKDIIYVDVMEEMKDCLRKGMKKSFNDRRTAKEIIDFMGDIKERMTHEGVNDFILNHLNGVIKNNLLQIQIHETDIKIGVVVRRLLREYDFKKNIKEQTFPPDFIINYKTYIPQE